MSLKASSNQPSLGWNVFEFASRPYTMEAQKHEIEKLQGDFQAMVNQIKDITDKQFLSVHEIDNLRWALVAFYSEAVAKKIENGIFPKTDDLTPAQKEQALKHAAYHNNVVIIRTLHLSGADMNAGAEVTQTALHVAAIQGHVKAVEALYVSGADLKAVNAQGKNALEAMNTTLHPKTAAMLRDYMGLNVGASLGTPQP